MQVRHHGGLGDARVGHDQRLVAIRFQVLAEDRMVVGDVRADQQHHVGRLHVFVIAGRPVAAERKLVAGHSRRHAERRVAVVIAGAEAELHQLAQRVELFGDQLARADARPAIPAPCFAWTFRNRSTIVESASFQLTGSSLPFLRSSGYFARFSAAIV